MAAGYREQLHRVERWYHRLVGINKGIPHNRGAEYYQDEVYAFFLNCYHLRDWIIHDSAVTLSGGNKDVDDFINNNDDLKDCADICNSLKHLKLDKPPRSGKQPRFTRGDYGLNIGGAEQTISCKYTIDTVRGPLDAFMLATRCLHAWKKFIEQKHI